MLVRCRCVRKTFFRIHFLLLLSFWAFIFGPSSSEVPRAVPLVSGFRVEGLKIFGQGSNSQTWQTINFPNAWNSARLPRFYWLPVEFSPSCNTGNTYVLAETIRSSDGAYGYGILTWTFSSMDPLGLPHQPFLWHLRSGSLLFGLLLHWVTCPLIWMDAVYMLKKCIPYRGSIILHMHCCMTMDTGQKFWHLLDCWFHGFTVLFCANFVGYCEIKTPRCAKLVTRLDTFSLRKWGGCWKQVFASCLKVNALHKDML